MHDRFGQILLLAALWPTRDFEFPADPQTLAEGVRQAFPVFTQIQRLQPPQGGAPLPPGMPRVVLSGQGEPWKLELAPARVNLHHFARAPQRPAAMFQALREQLPPLHSWLAERNNLKAYRIGLISRLIAETRSSASEKIADYFLQPQARQGQAPNEVQLSLMHRLTLAGGWMVNRWVRLQPMRTTDARRLDVAVQVEVDLNTMAEDTRVKTAAELINFLESAQRHVETEIPLLNDEDFFI